MKFMLDTDVCVDAIRLRTPEMLARIRGHAVGEIGVSSITMAELVFGAAKSGQSEQAHTALQAFVGPLEIAPFDGLAAGSYGGLRAALERRGATIGPFDTLIAGHALSIGATLVTITSGNSRASLPSAWPIGLEADPSLTSPLPAGYRERQ